MANQNKTINFWPVILFCLVLLVIVVCLNSLVSNKVTQLTQADKAEPLTSVSEVSKESSDPDFFPQRTDSKKVLTGDITGWKQLEPNRKYVTYFFFMDGKQIAQFNAKDDEVFDYQGNLFSGTVEFVDYEVNSKGTQEYKKGKRHGKITLYYNDGQLQYEGEYDDNKLVSEKEYFVDGALRMEVDLSRAAKFGSVKDVGVGKVYFRNGDLRYEWRAVDIEFGGYNKSYNRDGVLVEEKYFDSIGQPISKEQYYQNLQNF